MKRIFILFFISVIFWSAAEVRGQSAAITQDVMNEADVRSGGGDIRIRLSGVNFNFTFTDAIKRDIINGLSGSTAFELVKATIPLANVVRNNNRNATITLPATAGYFINANDRVTVVVPASALLFYFIPITASPDVLISNLNTSISFSGNLLAGSAESDIRNGGRTLNITADYNLWRPDLATTDVASVRAMFGAGTFRDEVASLIGTDNIKIDRNILSVSLPAAADYYIGSSESVIITVSSAMFQGPEGLNNASTSFLVANENPVVLLQDVTLQEADIRTTPQTFSISITGDKFNPVLNVSGLRNDFSGGTGWESYLEGTLTFTRINDFQLNVTIPANPSFNTDLLEEVSLSLGAENLQYSTVGSFPDPVNRVTLVPIVPTMTITSVPASLNAGNLDGAVLTATLTETRLNDLSVAASSVTEDPAISGLVINTPVNETYTSFNVPLSFSGTISEGQTLSIILDGSEVRHGADIQSNALPLSSTYVPVISSVSIPNQPMGIGDVVTATIFFQANDEPGPFTYVGGTIEDEPLDAASVRKINSSTYTATFTIQEDTPNRAADQRIRVRDLQFSNGGDVGPRSDYNIVQNNDEIDTEIPVVEHISYSDGEQHNIGSEVIGTVTADGDDYQFDFSRSTINNVSFSTPQITTENNNDGTYSVTYVPIEGDTDVPQGDQIAVELVMIDAAGNSNDPPVTTLEGGNSPVIDANSPTLDSAVVTNPGVKGIGDEVEIYLYASEELEVPVPPLGGTHVNFVPIDSDRVIFSQVSGNVYRLLYTVGAGDNGVGPGQLTYNLEMEDMLGNRSNSNIPLKNNSVTIGSALPSASILGDGAVCPGDSLKAFLYMTGTSPWDVVVSSTDGVYAILDNITSPYPIWLKPDQPETYTVTSVVDGNGIVGNTFDEAVVTIHTPEPVNIIMDRTTYLASEPGVELRADLEPGIFSGPGVAGGYFYPSIATPVGSPHTINYEYTDLNSCRSYDDIDVEVLEGTGSVILVSGEDTITVLCDDAGTYEIIAANKEGIPGTFELRLTNSTTVIDGHITDADSTDNRALFNPAGLNGGYDIIFLYVIDEVVLTATWFVRIDEIGTLEITTQFPDLVCQNEDPYELAGNMVDPLATWSFTGPGVSGHMSTGFWFDPSHPDVEVGMNTITYLFTTEGGCTAKTSIEVNVSFVPDVAFDISDVCIPEEGGIIDFKNRTTGKHAVERWSWDFGDIGSGINNFSSEENPSHFYREPGLRRINLTATTTEGCVTFHHLDTLLADKPDVDFTWVSDCFAEGSEVIFINRSKAAFSAIDTMVWSFSTDSGSMLGVIGASPGEDSVSFPFDSIGTYQVDLYVGNSGGCNDNLTKDIVFKPTIRLNRWGSVERFNSSEGGWSVRSDDGLESWVWNVPDFNGFEQDSTDKAWFTDLPFGVAGYTEQSWVQSPCYDFSEMKRPFIRLDIMKSFVPNLTGAVLQFQDVVQEGWKTVGLIEDGLNWYNSNTIFNNPGGSSFGWGLNEFVPDTDWVPAAHDLDTVAGNERVKFRIAIGTSGGQGLGNQGFAFDNVYIGERTRKSVLEHFTNSGDAASKAADDLVDAFYEENMWDLLHLQYHMDYPGYDPMSMNNPDPGAVRAGAKGVAQVPYAILDGGVMSSHRYDFSGPGQYPDSEQLKLLSLEVPDFTVDIDDNWLPGSLQAEITVTCNTDLFENNLQLYVALIESEVTAYTGHNQDTLFRNVVLDMLPSPQGKLLGNGWTRGMSETKSYSWEFPDYIEDVEDLGVVAFVEDREQRRILQASSSHVDSQVGIRDPATGPSALSVYPNPASDFVYINLGERPQSEGRLMVLEMSGKVVLQREVPPGYVIHQLGISSLPQGVYLICWMESGMLKGHGKLVRTR